jgi:hypothetical protein
MRLLMRASMFEVPIPDPPPEDCLLVMETLGAPLEEYNCCSCYLANCMSRDGTLDVFPPPTFSLTFCYSAY